VKNKKREIKENSLKHAPHNSKEFGDISMAHGRVRVSLQCSTKRSKEDFDWGTRSVDASLKQKGAVNVARVKSERRMRAIEKKSDDGEDWEQRGSGWEVSAGGEREREGRERGVRRCRGYKWVSMAGE
jgi:hypothetical protein